MPKSKSQARAVASEQPPMAKVTVQLGGHDHSRVYVIAPYRVDTCLTELLTYMDYLEGLQNSQVVFHVTIEGSHSDCECIIDEQHAEFLSRLLHFMEMAR